MSRSNPTANNPHPCQQWMEYSGSEGHLKHYDKEKKENIVIKEPFTFILLDELSVIKGWHDASESGITSNEIRDTTAEPLVVKAFKGGTLAEGFYRQIRDRIAAHGGHYCSNLYVAFRTGIALSIGSVQLKGAALSAWLDFKKKNRAEIYKKAVRVKGHTDGKKGQVKFKTPCFFIADVTPETDAQAMECDKELQSFLTGYFKRTRVEQVEQTKSATDEPEPPPEPEWREPTETRRPAHDPDLDAPTDDSDLIPF